MCNDKYTLLMKGSKTKYCKNCPDCRMELDKKCAEWRMMKSNDKKKRTIQEVSGNFIEKQYLTDSAKRWINYWENLREHQEQSIILEEEKQHLLSILNQ